MLLTLPMRHHRVKPSKQQRNGRLPNLKEEPEEEDEAAATHFELSAETSRKFHGKDLEETSSRYSATLAMDSDVKLELSPLPLQRALLTSVAGQKCGPTTPVPVWKMYDNPFEDSMAVRPALRAPASMAMSGRSCLNVSARKLAASLWELHGAPDTVHHRRGMKGKHNGKEKVINKGNEGVSPCVPRYKGVSSHCAMASSEMPDHARENVSQKVFMDTSRQHRKGKVSQPGEGLGGYQHQVVDGQSLHLRPQERLINLDSCLPPAYDKVAAATMSASSIANDISPAVLDTFRINAENGSTLSCELVKVLNQIWSLEEQYRASKSMVASLQEDLEKTKARVLELREEQSSHKVDMEMLNSKLVDERTSLQRRAQAAVDEAIKPLKEELEGERKNKQKLGLKHEKLSKKIGEVRKALVRALQDFEKEQKARELMEDVCDELAREIGEDKAQVEELKRQSAKVREEVEQERRMLQMAEVWREERVQMKLAEARLELEEKNSALDKLRGELEAFLKAKRSVEESSTIAVPFEGSRPIAEQANPSAIESMNNSEGPSMESASTAAPPLDGNGAASHAFNEVNVEGSIDDDLHSIELNTTPCQMLERGGRDILLSTNGAKTVPGRSSMERTKSNLVEALVVAEQNSSEIHPVDPNGLSKMVKRSVKDWDIQTGSDPPWSRDREGLPTSTWQDGSPILEGFTRGQGKGGLESLSRSGSKGHSNARATASSDHFHRDSSALKHEGLEPSEKAFGKPITTFQSSLTRQWDQQFWSSPDPPSSSLGANVIQMQEGKPSIGTIRDNSLKAKLLEAKLEGQRAKLRNSKVY